LQILLRQRKIHHRVHGEHRVFQFSLCVLCDLCGSKQKSANLVAYNKYSVLVKSGIPVTLPCAKIFQVVIYETNIFSDLVDDNNAWSCVGHNTQTRASG
jgi:hypothetical protein